MTNPVHGIAVGALVELLTKAAAQPTCLASSEDIMRMAQEAGFQFPNDYYLIEPTNRLKRFAALVAAAEREACAALAEAAEPYQAADLIRARRSND